MAPVPAVYDGIVGVSRDIATAGLAKTRSNQQQGYKFRGIDDVLNALSPLLVKHRLVILPRVLDRTVVERTSRQGGVLIYVTISAEFDIVSAVDGSTHTVRTYGEAMDSADKSTNKAMSAAYKYAAIQTFCIPTEGGEHDADAVTHEPVPAVRILAPALPDPPPVVAPTTKVPKGYVSWFEALRAAALIGTPALERAWLDAPKAFRLHLAATMPGAQADLKAIAGRLAGGGMAS